MLARNFLSFRSRRDDTAASDALCGKALGYYSRSQQHADAANLIRSIQPGGAQLASTFRQLAGSKDNAQYAPKTMGEASVKAAVRQAGELVSAGSQIQVPRQPVGGRCQAPTGDVERSVALGRTQLNQGYIL